jgi:hypothetical protein
MTMTTLVPRDERERAVDNAADRISFLVLAYGVLVVVAIRSLTGESSWDLLSLVVLAGAAGLVYRRWKGVATRTWFVVTILTAIAAAILAAVIASQVLR